MPSSALSRNFVQTPRLGRSQVMHICGMTVESFSDGTLVNGLICSPTSLVTTVQIFPPVFLDDRRLIRSSFFRIAGSTTDWNQLNLSFGAGLGQNTASNMFRIFF